MRGESGAVPLLDVRGLTTELRVEGRSLRPVDGVSFRVARGETLGLVGESGCGKTLTALSVMRLLPPGARIASGQVLLDGLELTGLPERRMRGVRGGRIAIVFQEPMTALNPVLTVGAQIAEAARLHAGLGRAEALDRAVHLLDMVAIPDPARRAREYPHEMSGGMRQRVLIAMALAGGPDLLIADEPTTSLDVTIQAGILDLLRKLQEELGLSILLIAHDFGVVAELASRVAVMYCGKIVEEAPVRAIFRSPRHPYTRGLLASIPPGPSPARPAGDPGPPSDSAPVAEAGAGRPGRSEQPVRSGRPVRPEQSEQPVRRPLPSIPGTVPDLAERPPGCAFWPRCPEALDRCRREIPELAPVSRDGTVACFLYPAESPGAGEDD